MRGKCNCGKKATGEWLIRELPKKREKYGTAWTMKWCDDCKPKYFNENIQLIDGR